MEDKECEKIVLHQTPDLDELTCPENQHSILYLGSNIKIYQ